MKMWKVYRLTDDGQQEIRKAHLNSGEVNILRSRSFSVLCHLNLYLNPIMQNLACASKFIIVCRQTD